MTVKSLLTPEQWAEARRLRAEGASLDALAEQFGVTHSSMGVDRPTSDDQIGVEN
jgi:hypothetical protein